MLLTLQKPWIVDSRDLVCNQVASIISNTTWNKTEKTTFSVQASGQDATAMQLQCNCNATAMQLQCTLIPIQADNFDFWDKGTEKNKKKKNKISDC